MKAAITAILFVPAIPIPSFSKPIKFIKEYTYDAGESDSLLSCRTLSLIEVKRQLLEDAQENLLQINKDYQKAQQLYPLANCWKKEFSKEWKIEILRRLTRLLPASK
jgi:hypothetical protein